MYARDVIVSPWQPLDFALLERTKRDLLEQNPELYRFMLESVGKEYPNSVGKWDRQIDVAVIGLAVLGAVDKRLDPSSYVLVMSDSIARARNKKVSKLTKEIMEFDKDVGIMFADAFNLVRDANNELNDMYGSKIDSDRMTQGVALYFDAYWQEIREQRELTV